MTDTVVASVITVGGMLAAGLLGGILQFFVTKHVLRAEHERMITRIAEESRERARGRTADRLLEIVSELLVLSDPQVNETVDYPAAVKLIHQAQLLLDRADAKAVFLNGRLNALGIALAGTTKHPDGAILFSRGTSADVLRVHGEVIDAIQAVLNSHSAI